MSDGEDNEDTQRTTANEAETVEELATTELLIEAVEKRSFLYDAGTKKHKDNTLVSNTWEAIGNEVGLPGTFFFFNFVFARS